MSVSKFFKISDLFSLKSYQHQPPSSHPGGYDCTDNNPTGQDSSNNNDDDNNSNDNVNNNQIIGSGGQHQHVEATKTHNDDDDDGADRSNGSRAVVGSCGVGGDLRIFQSVQQQQQQRQMYPVDELHQEAVRLLTFNNDNWTVPFLDKQKLAQIGFYYQGTQDVVKCYFCKVEIGKWEPDDDCFTEHYRWSSNCPLLRRQHTNNVPLDAEALDQILPPITYDTCGVNGVVRRPNAYAERSFTPHMDQDQDRDEAGSSSHTASQDEMGGGAGADIPYPRLMVFETPSPNSVGEGSYSSSSSLSSSAGGGVNGGPDTMRSGSGGGSSPYYAAPVFYNMFTTPHLEIEANRLKTYKEWPINLKMKPVELSDAGFFYTGMGDRVQCFSCGGGLKNWEDDDVAWEQHALWYGNCDYLKLMKGQRYIDAVVEQHRRKQDHQHGNETPGENGETQEAREGEQNEDELVEDSDDEPQPSTSRCERSLGGGGSLSNPSNATNALPKRSTSNRGVSSSSSTKSSSASSAALSESTVCKICFECEYNTAFIPCGHVVACAKCASAVTKCPMCREPYDSVTRIYFS